MTSSVHIGWLIENRVLQVQVSGSYDLTVAAPTVSQIKSMLDSTTEPIHVVCDMTHVTSIPRNIREPIQNLGVIRYHTNLGWLIFVTTNHPLAFAAQIGSRLLGVQYRAVNSLEDALATLQSIDPTLAVLPRDESAA